jgi:hypothetical protein
MVRAARSKQSPGLALVTRGKHQEHIAIGEVEPHVPAVALLGRHNAKAIGRVDPERVRSSRMK